MKDVIRLSRRSNIIIIAVFATLALTITLFLILGSRTASKEREDFIKTEIHSRILGLDDLDRGSYDVQLNVNDTVQEFNLPVAFQISRDTIRVGDSLTKNANSGECEIFRVDLDGRARKVSDWSVH